MKAGKYRFILFSFLFLTFFCKGQQKTDVDWIHQEESLNKEIDSSHSFNSNPSQNIHVLSNPKKTTDTIFSKIYSALDTNNYELALSYCKNAEKIIINYHLENKRGDLLMFYGTIYYTLNLKSQALRYFLQASKYTISDRWKSSAYFYLASIYFDIGNFEACKSFLNKSLNDVTFNHKDVFNEYIMYSDCFNIPDSINKYLNFAKISLTKYPKKNYEKVALLNNYALLYDATGKKDSCKISYLKAMKLAQENDFHIFLGNIYNNYAYVMMDENKPDSAEYFLKRALLLSRRYKDKDLEADIEDTYCDYYQSINKPEKAIEYLRLSVEKKDEYRTAQNEKESLFLSASLEMDQKEKEVLLWENRTNRIKFYLTLAVVALLILFLILILYRHRHALAAVKLETLEKAKHLEVANAMIEGQDKERKRMAMNLHDGLAANLGKLRLKIDTLLEDSSEYQSVHAEFSGLVRQVRELSHRMLPVMLEKQGLQTAIKEMIASFNTVTKINLTSKIAIDKSLSEKRELNVYYIVYELINNAIKHSEAHNIFVQLLLFDNTLNITVEDDGKGFDPEKVKKGLGLKNIEMRVEFLKGNIFYETDNGSSIMIEIPVNK